MGTFSVFFDEKIHLSQRGEEMDMSDQMATSTISCNILQPSGSLMSVANIPPAHECVSWFPNLWNWRVLYIHGIGTAVVVLTPREGRFSPSPLPEASPSAGPGGVSSVIDRQTPMTPTQSIHTMGVMGHMIVINSGFPNRHNHTVHSSFEDNFQSKLREGEI